MSSIPPPPPSSDSGNGTPIANPPGVPAPPGFPPAVKIDSHVMGEPLQPAPTNLVEGAPILQDANIGSRIPPPPPPPSHPSTQMKVPRKSNSLQDSRNLVSSISKVVIPASTHNNHRTYDDNMPTKILPPLNLPAGVVLPPTMDGAILATSERAMALMKDLNPSQIQAALNEFDEAMRSKGNKVRNAQAYLVGVIKRYLHVNRKERSGVGAPSMGKDITPVVKVTLQKLMDSNFCTQTDMTNNVMAKLKMLSEHDALLAINEISGIPRGTIRNFSSYFMGILNRYMRGEGTPHKHRNGRQTFPNNAHGGMGAGNAGMQYGNNGMQNNLNAPDGRKDRRSRHSRRDDDRVSNRHRRDRSHDSDYSDRSNGRSRRSRRSRRRDDSDDDYSRSPSSDRDYRSSRRSRRDRDTSRSSSQDRSRDRNDKRRYRSRSRSRSRSPYSRKRDRDSHRSSSRRSNQSNPIMAQPTIPGAPGSLAPFPGSIPPPPPPRNPQGQSQQWPTQTSYGQSALPIVNPAIPVFQPPPYAANGAYGQVAAPAVTATMPDLADILGIAEKAASAVQALNSRQQQPPPPPMGRMPPAMAQYAPQTSSYSTPAFQNHQDKAVILTDLTPMIQYSITNLRATGMLDKELGENACRLLKKMNETVALQALEKFSSCDGSIMRSKEGYLIGILRKASEKN